MSDLKFKNIYEFNNLTTKEAFDYDLELDHSILNCDESEAIQRGKDFLSSWILFHYRDLTEEQRYSVKRHPLPFLKYGEKLLELAS